MLLLLESPEPGLLPAESLPSQSTPEAESPQPEAESPQPEAESPQPPPEAESPQPEAESPQPEAESLQPEAEAPELLLLLESEPESPEPESPEPELPESLLLLRSSQWPWASSNLPAR